MGVVLEQPLENLLLIDAWKALIAASSHMVKQEVEKPGQCGGSFQIMVLLTISHHRYLKTGMIQTLHRAMFFGAGILAVLKRFPGTFDCI